MISVLWSCAEGLLVIEEDLRVRLGLLLEAAGMALVLIGGMLQAVGEGERGASVEESSRCCELVDA